MDLKFIIDLLLNVIDELFVVGSGGGASINKKITMLEADLSTADTKAF